MRAHVRQCHDDHDDHDALVVGVRERDPSANWRAIPPASGHEHRVGRLERLHLRQHDVDVLGCHRAARHWTVSELERCVVRLRIFPLFICYGHFTLFS